MKGRLEKHPEGWRCRCARTWTGYGATPEAAWLAWAEALRLSNYRDAYDQTEADYRRLDEASG